MSIPIFQFIPPPTLFPLVTIRLFSTSTTVYLFLSPTEGHLGCFQVWVIMNKAALNIRMQVFVWTKVFSAFE